MIPFNTLRTNHLFSGAGDNPLGIVQPRTEFDQSNPIQDRVLAQDDARFAHQQAIMDAARGVTDQHNYEQSQRGKNTVLAPESVNPLQMMKLQQNSEAEQAKTSRNTADIASREKIAANSLQEKQQYGNQVIDVRKTMADIAAFKAANPNAKVVAPKGGTIHLYDPVHGMVDTGIPTGNMTDADRMEAEKENRLEGIAATGDQSRKTETMRGDNALEQIGARGVESRATNAARPVAPKIQSEADKKVGYFNAAQKLANDPTFGKYLDFSGGPNTFFIKPGTPQDVYHNINSQIYGSNSTDDNAFAPGKTDFTPGGNSGKTQKETSGGADTTDTTDKKNKDDDPAGLFDDAPGDE